MKNLSIWGAVWAGTMAGLLVFLTVFVSPWLGLIGATAILIADAYGAFGARMG